jgi:hypothetical protein
MKIPVPEDLRNVLLQIVKHLCRRTRTGVQRWEETADKDTFLAITGGGFSLTLRNQTGVYVHYSLTIEREGKQLYKAATGDLQNELSTLFGLVHEQVISADSALRSLEEELRK